MDEEHERLARDEISRQIDQLSTIVDDARDGDLDASRERLARWSDRAVFVLREFVSPAEAKKLQNKRKASVMGDPAQNFADEATRYDAFLAALLQEIAEHPESVLASPAAHDAELPSLVAPAPAPQAARAVFIIHGHDELNVFRLKEMVRERWNLEPITLAREAGRGRTIIEKFEQEAERACLALALLTPDDIISVEQKEYAQARPNVIFELGWFYARLGRERVCILFQKGTQIHSDLNGISRIEFSDSVEEKSDELAREFAAAGIAG